MTLSVLKCPQCNAPLSPARHARQVVCTFCHATVNVDPSVVSSEKYKKALREAGAPAVPNSNAWSIAGDAWIPRLELGAGEHFHVFVVDRVRLPTLRAVLRLTSDTADRATAGAAWTALSKLQTTTAGADALHRFLPEPMREGLVESGPFQGRAAFLTAFRSRFPTSLAAAVRAYPNGIDPHVGLWAFRRLCEGLHAMHLAGFAHNAIVPSHVLLEENDHGATAVGVSRITALGQPRLRLRGADEIYEQGLDAIASWKTDVMLAARALCVALGGTADGARLEHLPTPYSEPFHDLATGGFPMGCKNAWDVREYMGGWPQRSLGKPGFFPFRMPA